MLPYSVGLLCTAMLCPFGELMHFVWVMFLSPFHIGGAPSINRWMQLVRRIMHFTLRITTFCWLSMFTGNGNIDWHGVLGANGTRSIDAQCRHLSKLELRVLERKAQNALSMQNESPPTITMSRNQYALYQSLATKSHESRARDAPAWEKVQPKRILWTPSLYANWGWLRWISNGYVMDTRKWLFEWSASEPIGHKQLQSHSLYLIHLIPHENQHIFDWLEFQMFFFHISNDAWTIIWPVITSTFNITCKIFPSILCSLYTWHQHSAQVPMNLTTEHMKEMWVQGRRSPINRFK